MNKIIMDDLYRYIGNKSNSLLQQLRYILFTPGFQYIYIYIYIEKLNYPRISCPKFSG